MGSDLALADLPLSFVMVEVNRGVPMKKEVPTKKGKG